MASGGKMIIIGILYVGEFPHEQSRFTFDALQDAGNENGG